MVAKFDSDEHRGQAQSHRMLASRRRNSLLLARRRNGANGCFHPAWSIVGPAGKVPQGARAASLADESERPLRVDGDLSCIVQKLAAVGGERSFAETRLNGEVAPIADLRAVTPERGGFDP
jgi:hypothetical protein